MTMFSSANRKFALAISVTALLAGASFATSPASAMDRYVGGGMWERAGTGAALPGLGDRPVGGGMYERAGTGFTPNGDRPVGGGMYEKAGTSKLALIGRTNIVHTKLGAMQITTRPMITTTARTAVPPVRSPAVTPVIHTTVGA